MLHGIAIGRGARRGAEVDAQRRGARGVAKPWCKRGVHRWALQWGSCKAGMQHGIAIGRGARRGAEVDAQRRGAREGCKAVLQKRGALRGFAMGKVARK